MKIVYFLFLSLLFSCVPAFGQNGFDVKFSEALDYNPVLKDCVTGADSKSAYSILIKAGNKAIVCRYDDNANIVSKSEIELNADFGPWSYKLITVGRKHWLVYIDYDKRSKIQTLYGKEIDVKNMSVSAAANALHTSEKISIYNYQFAYSEDNTQLLIASHVYSEATKKMRTSFTIVDNEMKQVVTKDILRPDLFIFSDMCLKNNGDIAYLIRTISAIADMQSGKWIFGLVKAGANENIEQQITNAKVSEAKILRDRDGYIVAGTYTNTNVYKSIDGIWAIRINADGSSSNFGQQYFEIPKKLINGSGTVTSLDAEDEGEIYPLILRQVIRDDAGAITIIGDVNGFGDIYAMNISATGIMNWCTKIKKNLVRENSLNFNMGFGEWPATYKMLYLDGWYYFFFLDSKSNLDADEGSGGLIYYEDTDGVLAAVTMSANGTLSKKHLWEYESKKGMPNYADLSIAGPDRVICSLYSVRTSYQNGQTVRVHDATPFQLMSIKIKQ